MNSKLAIRVILCTVFFLVSASGVIAQVSVGEKGTFSSTVFGDYYWMALNHDPELQGHNGFWLRRIYLTYDHQISEAFSSRVRLGMEHAGDFSTDREMFPFVKDAYLKWENSRHEIYVGISPTPVWELVEEVWEYRHVEKTVLDLQGFASSRDFGVAVMGSIDPGEKLSYHFMVGNGNSTRPELDRGKKFMLSLSYQFTDQVLAEIYGDFNGRADGRDIFTTQAFVAYHTEAWAVGAQYVFHRRMNIPGIGDRSFDMISLFSRFNILDSTKGFLRVDHLFDPNPYGSEIAYIPFSERAESTFLLGGVDLKLHQDVHLLPNIGTVIYGKDESGIRPGIDLIPRLTLMFTI